MSYSCESIATKCLRTLSGLCSPNLIDQSSCRILTTYAMTRAILHDDWLIMLGENRLDRALKYLVTMLVVSVSISRVRFKFFSTVPQITFLFCFRIIPLNSFKQLLVFCLI